MNCKNLNEKSLIEILSKLNHFPSKMNENEAWFLNPFREEIVPSFKVNLKMNKWFLFSESTGGSNVDFLTRYFQKDIPFVLDWAKTIENSFSFRQQKNENLISEKNYEITKISEVKNYSLKKLLEKRKVISQIDKLKEIHFKFHNNPKEYFGIGFKNNSGGFEFSNKYVKKCLLKKDISSIFNGNKNLNLFEGFWDYLSFLSMEELHKNKETDFIILNSTSNLDKIPSLKNYSKIFLWLDNDLAGRTCTKTLIEENENIFDCSKIYSEKNCKDLNEFYCKFYQSEKC